MKKIGLIGRVAEKAELNDGQTILTRMFKSELEKQIESKKIICVDTYNYKKRILKCIINTLVCLSRCDVIFIMLSRNGLSFYLPFLYYMNKIFKRDIYHRVIGGNLNELIERKPKWVKYLNSLKINYVEAYKLAEKLKNTGLNNVKVSPNFKDINPISINEISQYEKDTFKFCTFSRVVKEKGITDAINAINCIKNTTDKTIELDIYGPIADSYKNELEELLKDKKNIQYKGCISPTESVSVLKDYYMLLFPTYWEGEGFPGTFIDCFASGLPIIASDWNYNSELLEEGVTGYIYKRDEKNENLKQVILNCINNKETIFLMKKNCINEFNKYIPKNVIMDILKEINEEVK